MTAPDGHFTELQIGNAVERIAQAIECDVAPYVDPHDVVVVGVLDGCLFLMTDLLRRLPAGVRYGFVKAESYNSPSDHRAVSLVSHVKPDDVTGRTVIVVDDVCDTGHTLSYVSRYLQVHKPKRVLTAVLFDKPEARQVKFVPDYLGLPPLPATHWLWGYGMDEERGSRRTERGVSYKVVER